MKRLIVIIAVLILLGAAGLSAGAAYPTQPVAAKQAARDPGQSQQPIVLHAVKSDTSIPLRDIPATLMSAGPERAHFSNLDTGISQQSNGVVDSLVRRDALSPLAMPTPIQNFEGMMNYAGVLPPDTVGEVGLNHYVQMTNSGFQIFSKTGTTLYGPAATSVLFRGFGGVCESHDDGDPIVLYDQLADRWMLTQFISSAPYGQCIAVSTTPDPTGSYYRYFYLPGTPNNFGDYEKLAIWPDALYMSTNDFANGASFVGSGSYAFNKAKMYVGDPTAESVYFFTSGIGGITPADLDGYTQPPAGSPAFFYGLLNSGAGQIGEYKFHVDFNTPALSTFTGPFLITVAAWNDTLCSAARGRCVDQPGTTLKLESLSGRPMFRPTYRNFGSYEAVMLTHTVNATGGNPGIGGVRWYEIRDPNGTPAAFQQGTWAPADNTHRFMPSIAQDRMGNVAVGFSASNATTVYPSIWYAGRLVTDPVGQLSQGEAIMFTGTGSNLFPSAGRWGDYSDMTVDPADDCTFWYTNEYYRLTANVAWRTRIGSFKFPSCVGSPPPTTTPAPTQSPTPTPQASATACPGNVTVTGAITTSDPTQNGRRAGTVASSCAVPQPTCPGASSLTDPRHFDSYTYMNGTSSPQCVTVNINALGCTEAGIGSFTYLNSFDPNNLCTNYLANGGRNGANYSYSFTVPAMTTYVVVVMELEPNVGCPSYTISVNPCSTGGPTATVGPTNTSTPTSPVSTSTSTATRTATPGLTTTATGPPPPPTSSATSTTGTQTAVATSTSTACTITFSDVDPDNTFYTFIRCLACRFIISGYDDGTFRPFNDILRGQIAKMVSNAAGFDEDPGPQVYEDVDDTNPFYQWINRLTMRGHMGGYPCGTVDAEPCIEPDNRPYFRPFANATRGQLSKIVANAANIGGTPSGVFYTDVEEDNPFYLWIMRLTDIGVMSGYDCGGPGEPCDSENRPYFRPYNNVTRGQASKIVANTFFPDCQTPSRR